MLRNFFYILLSFILLTHVSLAKTSKKDKKSGFPNIVFILADDMGYGEVQVLNPKKGKIKTPHLDKMIKNGLVYTDAHSGSSVCTPTRYGLLTGRYAWRTSLQAGVLIGDGPCLIDKKTQTVAQMLKAKGYNTGMIGKWHLNWIAKKDGSFVDGPNDRGFDYFYGFHHSRTMEHVVRNGKTIAKRDRVTMLPEIEKESINYIKEHSKDAKNGKPFFLYVPLSSPHSPIVPSKDWIGKSGLSVYADFIMQTDHTVGQIINAIDEADLAENTLILFTADNGSSERHSNKAKLEEIGHYPSADLRGAKRDIWEGGHRVPFVARWTSKVKPGSSTDTMICLTDFMATVGELIGVTLDDDVGVDSVSFASTLFGEKPSTKRPPVVHHSGYGRFAIREDKWKLVLCSGSGGSSAPRDYIAQQAGAPEGQLYDLKRDLSEKKNLYTKKVKVVKALFGKLEKIVADGRSTAGPKQKNDIENIILWKKVLPPKKKSKK